MRIRPLQDRLVVERLEEREVKKGGIVIPDTAREKPQEGRVIAVGNGKVTDDGKKISLDVNHRGADHRAAGGEAGCDARDAAWRFLSRTT